MVSTEEEVVVAVVAEVVATRVAAVAEEVGGDLATRAVVEVPLHLFEVATVAAEDRMTVVGLGDVPEEGMCFARLTSIMVNLPL